MMPTNEPVSVMNSNPSRTEKRKQQTRQRIKQATIQLLRKNGYETLSIHDIMEEADLGRGTFYIHFSDKESVVWEVIRESFKTYSTEIEEEVNCPCGIPDAQCFWWRIFKRANENRELYQILFTGTINGVLTQWMYQYLSAIIAQRLPLILDVEKANIPPQFAVQMLTGAVMRLVIWWLENPDEMSYYEMGEKFYQMTLRMGQDLA
jgi:AcrR family transcriptional regulator